MNFGVPNQRRVRVEKYPDKPVMTLLGYDDTKKGSGRKVEFNKKATELLGLPENNATVAFSFTDDGIFVANGSQSGIPDDYGLRITKTVPRSFSNKSHYEYIVKVFELDTDIDNEFSISETSRDEDGVTVYAITPLVSDTNDQDSITDFATANDVMEASN